MHAAFFAFGLIGATGALTAYAQSTPAEHSAQGTAAEAEEPASGKQGARPSKAVQEKFEKLEREMAKPSDMAGSAPAARLASDTLAPSDSPSAGAAAVEKEKESPGLLGLAAQVFFGLAFVLLLAVVGIRLLKKLQGQMLRRANPAASGNLFEVLETCHLGQHHRIVALRISGEVGIVGVTQNGMNLLTMLKEPADEVIKRHAAGGNAAAFSENLNKILDRFKKPKRVSDLLEEA